MKIRRIDLGAFGRFTDASIHFGQPDGKVHLVHGANEAGKSTLLRAIWAYFYGDLKKSSDAYAHAIANLRIGMTLESPTGEITSWTRRAGGAQSLRDESDQPVAPERLHHLLANLSETAFRSQFAINHHELSLGSKQLYAQKGELGSALFAVASGLTSINLVASELAEEADAIFSPGSRKKPFNEAAKRIETLKKSLRDSAVSTGRYNEVVRMRDMAAEQAQSLRAQKTTCQDRERLLQRIIAGIPKVVRLAELKAELAALPPAPSLGPRFGERRQAAIKSRERMKDLIRYQEDQLGQLSAAKSKFSPSDASIELLPLLTPLTEGYGEYAKAQLDRSRLEIELKQCQRASSEVRRSLASDQIEAQVPPRHDLHHLRRKLAEHQTKAATAKALERETSSIEAQLARTEAESSGIGDEIDLRPLKSAIESALRRASIDQEIERLSIEISKQEGSTQAALKSLAIDLAPEAFLASELPSLAAIADFEKRLSRIDKQIEECERAIQNLEDATQNISHRLAALLGEAEVPSEQDMIRARAQRDRLWKEIRAQLGSPSTPPSKAPLLAKIDGNLADEFDAALREADRLADLLRSEARCIAERAELQKEQAIVSGKLQTETLKREKCQADRDALLTEWSELAKSAPTKLRSPAELKEWHPPATRLQDQLRKLFGMKSEADQLQGLEIALVDSIKQAAKVVGLEFAGQNLAEILPAAQERLEAIETDRSRRAAASQQRKSQTHRLLESRSERSAAQADLDAQWQEIQTWLANWKWGAVDSAGHLEHLLHVMEELERLEAETRDKQYRVGGIDRDAEDFELRLRDAARKLGIAADDAAISALNIAVTSHLRAADQQLTQRREIEKQIAEISAAQEKNRQELVLAESDLKALMLEAGADSIDALGVIEEQVRFRRLKEEEQARLETELTDLCDGQKRDEFVAACHATNLSSARQEIEVLQAKALELDEQIELQRREVRDHEAWLRDNQTLEKVASEEQALQESQAELAALVREHVKSRLAAEVLTRAMRRYRDDNQGDLLKMGGAIYSRLTGGAYVGIRAEVSDAETAELSAERTSPPHVPVTQLSDGARDQLYLALRIATLQKHFQSHPPMPFIVDDIFVMFDETRTLAALKELALLAETTQVIIFTHHAHVLELALSGLGDRCVTHELTQTGPFRTSAQIHQAHTSPPAPIAVSPTRKRGKKNAVGNQ